MGERRGRWKGTHIRYARRYSPDGRSIVTASMDHTARIWDGQSGQSLRTLQGHTAMGAGRPNTRWRTDRDGEHGQDGAHLGGRQRQELV